MTLFPPNLIRGGAVILTALLALLPAAPGRAAGVEDFYKGRTVNVIIGYSVGGGYDLYARLLARYMGNHIPGQPTLVPQNMPGAGSLKAANYLFYVAPKDGATIGTFSRSMGLDPLLGGDGKYDATKFTWLGSMSRDTSLCVSWYTSPIQSWNDMLTKQYTVGGNGAGSDPDAYALAIKNVFGAKVKLVTGFPGTADIGLAVERGELDGLCGLSYSTAKSRYGAQIAEKKLTLLVQLALQREPELPQVPLITDLATNPEQLQIMKLVLGGLAMARPYTAPPGIPEDRAAALRTAFDETMKDPAFLAEAEKLDLEISPVSSAAIEALLAELYATPQDVVKQAIAAVAN